MPWNLQSFYWGPNPILMYQMIYKMYSKSQLSSYWNLSISTIVMKNQFGVNTLIEQSNLTVYITMYVYRVKRLHTTQVK